MAKTDIYFKKDEELKRQNVLLDKSILSQRNKDLIKLFQASLHARQITQQRIAKLTLQLRYLAIRLKKDFDALTYEDIQLCIAGINQETKLSPATKCDYVKTVKQFYRWYKLRDERLDEVDIDLPRDQIKQKQVQRRNATKLYQHIEQELTSSYKLTEIDPASVITEEDLHLIVEKGCRGTKEKAFVSVLHETGCRIGEFLGIRLKDIEIKDQMSLIHVDGKTGRRCCYVVESVPFLVKWLAVHPEKGNSEAFLWVCTDNSRYGAKLRHIGASKLIKRVIARSGLNKPVNPHWFRHSRASILATKVTEPVLRRVMGWSKSSTMIKHYGHFASEDIMQAVASAKGIRIKESETKQPIKCSCGALNPHHEEHCYKCHRPLKVDTVLREKEVLKTTMAQLFAEYMEMSQDPQKMADFQKFKKGMGAGKIPPTP